MDHSYMKSQDRVAGFQVITTRNGPDHSYSCGESPPRKVHEKRKRDTTTPTGKTPQQLTKKKTASTFEETRHVSWTEDEKGFLLRYSKRPRNGVSETTFWKGCAEEMEVQFPGKCRTGHSCKSASRRLCLLNEMNASCETSLPTPDINSSSIGLQTAEIGVQTEWSFPQLQTKSEIREGEWLFMEPRKTIEHSSRAAELLNQTALKRLRRFAPLKQEDRASLMETLCSGTDSEVADKVMKSPLRGKIILELLYDIENSARENSNRRSVLHGKDYEDLSCFSWDNVIEELLIEQPLLAEVLLAITLPTNKIGNSKSTNSLVPVIGAVYGMLMKQRFHELSLIQKVVSVTLANEQTHQKVYDRLQPLGITLSHSGLLSTMDNISGYFNSELIEAVQEGKKFRIVGDNINFQLGVSHARKSDGKVRHMEHWFGSAAIIQNKSFDYLSDQSPQCDLRGLPVSSFLLADEDWSYLTNDLNQLVARTIAEFFPWLKFAKRAANKDIPGEHNLQFKNKVIPLPIMAKNEQKYGDVISILDSYESLVHSVHASAGIQSEHVHIGGDQLTRERFSGAKRLRAAALTPEERLEHLKPVTFELFHLQMTVLASFYQILYHTSNTELYTLHAQKIRLQRKDADGSDVKNHYNDCKELAVSFIKGYIVEAACEFFEIENTNSTPNIQIPDSTNMTDEDINKWLCSLVRPLVEGLLIDSRKSLDGIEQVADEHRDCDSIHVYSKIVVELGLVYMQLNDVIKVPDRNRLLRTLKYLMVFLKCHNNRSKYALEILKVLCQQLALLSEKVASSSLYGLFVNTGGKTNTHIPADLQMEHLVRVTKNHLKSMCSNVSETSMKKRSSSFHGMNEISENFDSETHVLRRSQKHKTPSSYQDEVHLMADLRSVRPFHHICGRRIYSMNNTPKNPITKVNMDELNSWIDKHKLHMFYEIGQ